MIKLRKKLLILTVALLVTITLPVITYFWFSKENLQADNQECPSDGPDTGSIEGSITDNEGLPLAGLNVTILNGTTFPRTTVETNHEGYYQIEGIPAGKLQVVVQDSQEKTLELENITIISGQTSTLNFNITKDSICPKDDSPYKWTPIGTRSENFNWQCLRCGYRWTNSLPEEAYESWRNKFLEPDFVRDYTLLYLKTILKKEIQNPLTLEWVGGRETPEQTLGYETFIYKAGHITVTIGYPVVLPKNIIYEIKVEVGDLTIWKGQLHRREFTWDSQLENAIYDHYGGVGFFEQGIYVSATTSNPLITEETPSAVDTNIAPNCWQLIHENVTEKASADDFISIIISRGDQPTGGYEIKINQFSWLESYPVKFRFQADFINPGEDVAVTQALTNPLVLFPIGKLTPGEYHIEVHILLYFLEFDEEGNPTYTQAQTLKEEVWKHTFTIQ